MTTCEQIQADAAGLAALAPDDPERVAAFAHARTCPACALALGEGVALFGLLELATPAPALHPEVLARAAAEIRRELGPPATARWRQATAVVLAGGAAWLVALAGGRRLIGAPAAPSAIALAAVAAVAAALAITLWSPLLAALPLASLIGSALSGGPGPIDPLHGLRCMGVELATAILPLAATFWLARRGAIQRPALALATAGAAGALMGQAALEVTCRAVHSHGHLVAFHSGGVLLALVLGAAMGAVYSSMPSMKRTHSRP
jgi:hypothetical protein